MSHSKLLILVVGLYISCIFLCAVFSVTLFFFECEPYHGYGVVILIKSYAQFGSAFSSSRRSK